MRHLSGLESLADSYDGFIVDLWGVVHDGVLAYPGAVECLRRLRGAGKRVVLLSNAPRRVTTVQAGLRGMGIDDALYDGLLTSGEAARKALIARTDPGFAALGRRALHIGPARDRDVLEGTDLVLAGSPAQADFILNSGPYDEEAAGISESELALLRDCVARGLPMLCINPDLEIVRGDVRILCAGMLARHYALQGGAVRLIGKPYPEVYAAVRAVLGTGRILAVGDALATDIAGARAAGLDSLWVLGGIHAEVTRGDNALAEAEAAAAGLSPVATVPGLRW